VKNWTLGRKLMTGFGVTLALTTIGQLGGALAVNTAAKKMELAGAIHLGFQQMMAKAKNDQLSFVIDDLDRTRDKQKANSDSGIACSSCMMDGSRDEP
jgi:hypothetical protein